MTDDNAPTPDTNTEESEYEPPHPEADVVLEVLIGTVTRAKGMAVGITLNTTGGVVTGNLVSRDEWMDQWFESVKGNEMGEAVVGAFRDAYADDDPSTDDDGDPTHFGYVHLVDARHVQGRGLIPDTGPGAFWRGRLTEVAGWSMTNIAPGAS